MKILNFFKNLFKKKGKEDKGLIIQAGLPPIPDRIPLVIPEKPTVEKPKTQEELDFIDKQMKSCSVCKFALHDSGLDDSEEIICTLDPNRPTTKNLSSTCSSHEPKYKNLKVIVDKGYLMEYDSEKTLVNREDKIPDIAIEEIGEDQWRQ